MATNITTMPITVYQFDVGWLAYYPLVCFLTLFIIILGIVFNLFFTEKPEIPTIYLVAVFVLVSSMFAVIELSQHPKEQREERITAQATEHRDEIDHAVQDWLDDYDIELSTLCQNTYSQQSHGDSVTIQPLDVEDTAVCGTGTQDSIHIIDNEHIVETTLTQQGKLQLFMLMR